MKEIKFEDLVGIHILSGVQYNTIPSKNNFDEDCDINTIDFIIDGIAYSAKEDPTDGYRSYCDTIVKSKKSNIINTFPGQIVNIELSKNDFENVLKFINPDNNESVLTFGTTYYYDGYYPMAIISFMPEHFSIYSKNN